MPILPYLPPSEGYEPPYAEPNPDEGVLDITGSSSCTLIEDNRRVADILILRCRLTPIPLQIPSIKAQLIADGVPLEAALLYQKESISLGGEAKVKDSHYRGIGLDYIGIGKGITQGHAFPIQGNTFPTGKIKGGPLLYIKPFQCEETHHLERVTTFPSGDTLVSPPGILNALVLRGYGGYYKEGSDLESIQQIYYHLTSTHTQTRVRLFNSAALQKNLTPPPHGGQLAQQKIIFHPLPREEEYLSLPGALAAGYAKLMVEADGENVLFTSFLCRPVSDHPTLINVHFKPQ